LRSYLRQRTNRGCSHRGSSPCRVGCPTRGVPLLTAGNAYHEEPLLNRKNQLMLPSPSVGKEAELSQFDHEGLDLRARPKEAFRQGNDLCSWPEGIEQGDVWHHHRTL